MRARTRAEGCIDVVGLWYYLVEQVVFSEVLRYGGGVGKVEDGVEDEVRTSS